jgi:hypothetical protein
MYRAHITVYERGEKHCRRWFTIATIVRSVLVVV